jgi:hypothetical protein
VVCLLSVGAALVDGTAIGIGQAVFRVKGVGDHGIFAGKGGLRWEKREELSGWAVIMLHTLAVTFLTLIFTSSFLK